MSTTSDAQISDWSQKVKDMDQTGAIEHDPDINIWRTEQEIMEQAEQSELINICSTITVCQKYIQIHTYYTGLVYCV
jgi:hypothetical protein